MIRGEIPWHHVYEIMPEDVEEGASRQDLRGKSAIHGAMPPYRYYFDTFPILTLALPHLVYVRKGEGAMKALFSVNRLQWGGDGGECECKPTNEDTNNPCLDCGYSPVLEAHRDSTRVCWGRRRTGGRKKINNDSVNIWPRVSSSRGDHLLCFPSLSMPWVFLGEGKRRIPLKAIRILTSQYTHTQYTQLWAASPSVFTTGQWVIS